METQKDKRTMYYLIGLLVILTIAIVTIVLISSSGETTKESSDNIPTYKYSLFNHSNNLTEEYVYVDKIVEYKDAKISGIGDVPIIVPSVKLLVTNKNQEQFYIEVAINSNNVDMYYTSNMNQVLTSKEENPYYLCSVSGTAMLRLSQKLNDLISNKKFIE